MIPRIDKLEVWRTLSDGQQVLVGQLALNQQGVFFQYDDTYLDAHPNLAPFNLAHTNELQAAPKDPHKGLHGAFADSLPDSWGLMLQDRSFRQQGALPAQITSLHRLAYVGDAGTGALDYRPALNHASQEQDEVALHSLGIAAQAVFDGQTDDLLGALLAAGSSGGARPKVQVYLNGDDFDHCRTSPKKGDDAWLVKFTSQYLPLGHEEGICEAVYLTLAAKAGLEVPTWQLLPAPDGGGASHWLALKRFDRTSAGGKLHLLSACGLLDADFRSPSLDYEDLIKASRTLCKSPLAGQVQFRRAAFNLLACNQDDHSKNWAFLQDNAGHWSLAPFYDVTFSPHTFGEHATAYAGFGSAPPIKAMQNLAAAAGFADWSQARQVLEEVASVVADFAEVAKAMDVKPDTLRLIGQQLESTRLANRALLESR
ncbi:MAG: type II toxin-antitoxin system HipA family toxin [Pseudomonadales bacterium]